LRSGLISQCGTMFALTYFGCQLTYSSPVFSIRLTIESTTQIAKRKVLGLKMSPTQKAKLATSSDMGLLSRNV